MDSKVFETLSPTRLFFRCAIPCVISMAVAGLYSIADGIFVGRFIGQDALAAVNFVMPLIFISFALADLIAAGSAVQISIFLGKRDCHMASRIFSSCVKVIILISWIIGIGGYIFAEPLIKLMGASGDVLVWSVEYLRIYAVFSPFIIIFYAVDNYLRACGYSNYSMVIGVSTSVLNILLDYIFIVVLKQGVESAAFASCISMTVATILSFLPFVMKKTELKFVKGRIPFSQLLQIVLNGSSEFFTNIAGSVMMIIFNTVLMSVGGTVAVAAESVVMYIESLVGMIIFGMSSSIQPAISYCYGAGNMKRVWAIQKRMMIAAAIMSFGALLFLRYGGELVLPFFMNESDQELYNLSLRAIQIFAFTYLVGWIDATLSGLLTALEKPIQSLIISILGTLVFPILCLSVLAPIYKLDGIWMVPVVSGIFSAISAIFVAGLFMKKTKSINVTIN